MTKIPISLIEKVINLPILSFYFRSSCYWLYWLEYPEAEKIHFV